LRRLRLDLHDGPLQDLVALGIEVELLREQLGSVVPEPTRGRVAERLDDLLARTDELYRQLGELARSLEPRSLAESAFLPALEAEVEAFTDATAIDAKLEVRGDFDLLSDSQRIALLQVVREALSNVREHSGATSVRISVATSDAGTTLSVRDDGGGFDLRTALERARRERRLGLTGMAERVELLDGELRLQTRIGGPTEISAVIPAWRGSMS
jgi:signal transduction histidine kinase